MLAGLAPAFLALPSHSHPQSFSVYNKTSFYLSSLMLGDDQRHTRADIAAAHSCYDRFCLGVITHKIFAVTALIIKQFQ